MSLENLFNAIKINRGEKEPSRDEILDSIRFSGIEKPLENPEIVKIVSEYSSKIKVKFEEQNQETAEIELSLHMADIYFEAGETDGALVELNNAEEKAQALGNNELLEKIRSNRAMMTETIRM